MGSFIVFGVDWVKYAASINWFAIIYVILSVVATVYGSMRLYESGGGIRSTIYGIGSAVVFIFFGYRWFSGSGSEVTKWPPIINMCPDYLTYVPAVQGSKNGGCVDMLGMRVSGGSLEMALKSDVAGVAKTSPKVFPFTVKDVNAATTSGALQIICDQCKASGVTWEGVYDGDVCTAIKVIDAKKAALAKCVDSA